MRYLSLLAIVAVMYWSWSFVKSPVDIPEITHMNIQEDIKMMIEGTMLKTLPTVVDLRFDKFWTQTVTKDAIRANFVFSFENSAEVNDPARYGIEGYALLNYNPKSRLWDVEGPYFFNNQITFKNGVVFPQGPEDGE